MKLRHPRVLDASALAALFDGHPRLYRMLGEAEAGWWTLVLPAVCMADAAQTLETRPSAWDGLLLTPGVLAMPLAPHTAVEVAGWPGSLQARHAAHEATALRAAVVTCDPPAYDGLLVALLPV